MFEAICPKCDKHLGSWVTEGKMLMVMRRHQKQEYYERCPG